MERKIGETFELEGTTLRVTEIKEHTCKGCYLMEECYREKREVTGECFDRTDKKNVIFTEVEGVTEQQDEPTGQPEQELNLLEKLKYCPKGTQFWSPMLGDVKFMCVGDRLVTVEDKNTNSWDINADSTLTIGGVGGVTSEEPMLFPSREQRDWSKVEYKPTIDTLPRSWQEFCETHEVQKGEAYIKDISTVYQAEHTGDTRDMNADKNILPSKQAVEAHLALMQLHQLRDCWREGWMPDWKDDNQIKYVIYNIDGCFKIGRFSSTRRFLAFQDEKRADEFKDCFIDLIKQAGDLI